MAEKMSELRYKVLEHIAFWETEAKGCRVPDAWIAEAEASILDGQTTPLWPDGRKLTPAGRRALDEATHDR